MLTVEKIGGTSMSALDVVIKNIILYGRKPEELYNRVFVVSAFAGVTDLLLENKKTVPLAFTTKSVNTRISVYPCRD